MLGRIWKQKKSEPNFLGGLTFLLQYKEEPASLMVDYFNLLAGLFLGH